MAAGASVEPFREFMPALPSWVGPLVYVATGLTAAVLLHDGTVRLRRYGVNWRTFGVELWRRLADQPRTVLGTLAAETLGQRRTLRDREAGVMHALIFGSLVLLTLGTVLVGLDHDIAEPLGWRLLRGNFYLAYKVVLDTAGLLLLVGVLWAMWRRYVRRVPRLGAVRDLPLVHVGLLYVVVTSFLLEGLRLLVHPVPWATYSYVGWAVSKALRPLADNPVPLYQAMWAAHVAGAFLFMAVVLRCYLAHVLLLPANVMLQAGRNPARLSMPFNLAAIEEEGLEELTAGIGTIDDLDWSVRLSVDACLDCGRCDAVCPAHAAGRPLSPRQIVRGLAAELETRARRDGDGDRQGDLFQRGVVAEDAVWSCVQCGACARECPAHIDQPAIILDLRRHLVAEARVDGGRAELVANVERHGNPLGLPSYARASWLADHDVPTVDERPGAEYVYWIGCMAAYDSRARKVAEAMLDILRFARVDFAVLGARERCLSESSRKAGDEAGFQVRALENIAALDECGARTLLTHCPHCLQVLGQDYPRLGGDFRVLHHTQLLEEFIRQGRIPAPAGALDGGLTYHDPCTLSRVGGEYEAPRAVARFIAGGPIAEMPRRRERTFCCGAGGGNYWWKVPERERISHMRLREAKATNAGTVATACPFCLAMLEDATQAVAGPRVRDLAELVAAGLPKQVSISPQEPTSGGAT